MKKLFALQTFAAILGSVLISTQSALAQTTGFTYQGQLQTGANPASGSYDMAFALFDANVAGDLIAGPITNSAVSVSNGLFTVTLNFGSNVFTGTNYWVQMAVSPAGAGTFSTLVPRQQLTPTPYAISTFSLQSPQVNALCPPGSVMAYMGTTAPAGWLFCDGSLQSRTNYAALFAVIGTASGAGDGATTFNLPDMRGYFLRGADNAAGYRDPDQDQRTNQAPGGNWGNYVGSYQADMYASHTHSIINPPNISFYVGAGGTGFQAGGDYSGPNYVPSVGASGGNETRPKNVYVNYIIKY